MDNSDKRIIRDLVHDYFVLSSYELEIIDTAPFQRLKDIRQLTCHHVFPCARHTRFEHSLGVLELTKRVIKSINSNGFIENKSCNANIINESNKFNTQIAALLHDVGHCPFSHMGEAEMDAKEVRNALIDEITCVKKELHISDELFSIIKDYNKPIGAIHEQLSCIAIIYHYRSILCDITRGLDKITIDFDLIIRCILGINYSIDITESNADNIKIKNLCINLINNNAFDMDKLDYIMRDSLYTGIGTPKIDTKRLFRNIKISKDYKLVFMSKAIPVLQNLIESRDNLYLWVYNHHLVIYSDFIYGYIFRRLGHNAKKAGKESKIYAGIVPENFIFSVDSIISQLYSDSDVQAILNVQYRLSLGSSSRYSKITSNKKILNKDITRALALVKRLQNRSFLKPWWKTVFEFNNFMQRNFPDDSIRSKICRYVSHKGEYGLDPYEFRSQIAKHVIYFTNKMHCEKIIDKELTDGDFFIVQRSNRFFELETIENFIIYLRKNEIIDTPNDVIDSTDNYYGKVLTNLIPQKEYSSMYQIDGFYIYVQKYEKSFKENQISNKRKKRNLYYNLIEKSFVFIATELIKLGEISFVNMFQNPNNNLKKEFREKMWNKFYLEVLDNEKN